jgi:DDE superfamily endonuclease/helix-turn-helix, Psq domain/Tc5 transposase DNA-binding domain
MEGRITLAVHAIQQGSVKSINAASIAYDVPYSTLYRRVNGCPARRDTRPASCKLTQTEESTLVEWVLSMDRRGLAPTTDIVHQMANLLLQKRSQNQANPPPTIGQRWVYNLVRRHKALKSNFNRKYDYQRAKCEDPALIRPWFQLVRNIIEKYGILDADIYNFDETGFQMGVISTAKVITGAERSNRPVSVQPGNREWVTAIDCICADGQSLPPVIIFEGKMHQSTWYNTELPEDWVIGVSDNGWTDNTLGLTWLKNVFEKHTVHRTKGVYRLLILDGHGSHLTPEFDLFCTEHLIITLCMPPHSSHLLQPCDVSFFAVLKRRYGQQIQGYMRRGTHHIDKQDFLEAYHIARTEAATIANIQSGFAATGLVPHDPERVLSKLRTQLKTPTPPSSSHAQASEPWQFKTPHDTAQLELQARAIKDDIQRALPTPTNRALSQIVKGCQLAMNSAVLLAEEVRQLRHEAERQKKKRAKKRTYIAKGGVLTIQEGRDLSQNAPIVPESGIIYQEEARQPRAPRKCSMCYSLEHTARTCPLRQTSN